MRPRDLADSRAAPSTAGYSGRPFELVQLFRQLGRVSSVDALRWHLCLENGFPVDARLSGDWLVLETPAPHDDSRLPVRHLLRRHDAFPGNVKYAVTETSAYSLRVEVPLDDSSPASPDPDEQTTLAHMRKACLDLMIAASNPSRSCPVPAAAPELPLHQLEAFCQETGWRTVPGDGGPFRIALEEHEGGISFVSPTPRPTGMSLFVNFRDPLPSCLGPESIEAMAILMLHAGSCVRLARARFAPDAEIGFETILPAVPRAADMDTALSVLTTATRLAVVEIEAVGGDPHLARAYLAARQNGNAPIPQPPPCND
jgi:hypothetical protein